MITITKNTGQYHPNVAYVADIGEPELSTMYHGCGPVKLTLNGVEIVGFTYLGDEGYHPTATDSEGFPRELTPAECDAKWPGSAHAAASCCQLCIDRGTAAAAILNVAQHKSVDGEGQ